MTPAIFTASIVECPADKPRRAYKLCGRWSRCRAFRSGLDGGQRPGWSMANHCRSLADGSRFESPQLHQVVRPNPRDFLRLRIGRHFRSLPRQGPVSVGGSAISNGNSWRVSPKVSGRGLARHPGRDRRSRPDPRSARARRQPARRAATAIERRQAHRDRSRRVPAALTRTAAIENQSRAKRL